ncbi:MAG: response regulator [Candidatus Acidiferrum sp.]
MTGIPETVKERRSRFGVKPTILLVDKEEAIRELIRDMLDGQGFEIIQASDAAGALDLARREGQKIDLLVTEAEPIGMKAQELTRLLYKVQPKMRILFMAGKFDEGFAFMLGDQAERLFLLKPFTRAALLQKINGILL